MFFLWFQLNDSAYDSEEFEYIIAELTRYEIAEAVYESVWLEVSSKLQQSTVPQFWRAFQDRGATNSSSATESIPADKNRGFYQFQVAVYELHKDFGRFLCIVSRLQMFKRMCRFSNAIIMNRCEATEFGERLRATLLSQLPANFNNIIHDFYNTSFKVFLNSQSGTSHIYLVYLHVPNLVFNVVNPQNRQRPVRRRGTFG